MSKVYEIMSVDAEMFNCNENYPGMIGFQLNWVAKGIGFGQLSFYYDTKKQTWECDSECMGEDFCQAVLEFWLHEMFERK